MSSPLSRLPGDADTQPVDQVPPLAAPARSHRAITFRSVLLGLAGTVLISVLTPYNDLALYNTFMIGSYLPLALVTLLFVFALLVNGPLSRFAPRYALTTQEATVAFVMILAACAVPGNGLMKYWVPTMIAPLYHAQTSLEYRQFMEALDLPSWIFPGFSGDSMSEWINDPVVTGFAYRWTGDGLPPYLAWVQPALTWGIFIFALYGTMICLIALVHRQWYENERLAFPLATVQLALVQQPEPGRFFNRVFATPVFWVGFGGVFFLHLLSGAAVYWPQFVPAIPLSYDLTDLMADPPWVFTDTQVKEALIYFSVIGVTYFISTSVAFSLWFFFILRQLYRMGLGTFTGSEHPLGEWDVHSGGLIAYALMTLWIGRKHWKLIIQQGFRGHREGEAEGRYLSHRFAFWGFVICLSIMIGFLTLAGAGVGGAAMIVLLLVTLLFTMTRIVAETGLIQGQLLFQLFRPFQLASMAGWMPVSTKTFYYASMLHMTYYDNRESLAVYAAHGMKVTDQTIHGAGGEDGPQTRRFGRKLIALMFLALAVAYITSLSSMLWTEYEHAVTLDSLQYTPINTWPMKYMTPGMMNTTIQYDSGNVSMPFNPWYHLGTGFVVTIGLTMLRLYYAWWPLHPVGFIMMPTGPVLLMWFSIFLGWLAKTIILRLGGNSLYQGLKPFFIGLIVGEAGAAAVWLIVAMVLSSMGMSYERINILPY